MSPSLLVLLLAAGPPTPTSPLEHARTLFVNGHVDEGLGAVLAHRQEGGLDARTLAQSYLLEGMGRALLGDGAATLAFHRALTLDAHVDPGVKQAVVREPFEAAKRTKLEPALRVVWRELEASDAATPGLEVRLVVDAYQLVRGVREPAARGSQETEPAARARSFALEVSAPVAFLPKATPPVVVVDEHGNEVQTLLGEARGAEGPPSSSDDTQPDRFAFAEYPWGTIAGAGVMALGLVGAVGFGALVAAYDRGLLLPDVIDPVARLGFLVGLVAGVVVVVAGGAGIVADQLVFGDLLSEGDGAEPSQPEITPAPSPAPEPVPEGAAETPTEEPQ